MNANWLYKNRFWFTVGLVLLFIVIVLRVGNAEAQALPTPTGEADMVVVPPDPADPLELKAYAESFWGEPLPWPVPEYVSGQPGFPLVCAGLCWDTSHVSTDNVMRWYGPSDGAEDITQSPEQFGNNTPGPLDLMRVGKVRVVIFPLTAPAQIEMCALPDTMIDGVPATQILRTSSGGFVPEGDCGVGALSEGYHVVENNWQSPVSGFGVRFTSTQWAAMTEAQVLAYTGFWEVRGSTATWNPQKAEVQAAQAADVDTTQVLMTPAMISMMRDFKALDNVVFTTSEVGQLLFCNGSISGTLNIVADGACRTYEAPPGVYTYTAPMTDNRTSSGISWRPGTSVTSKANTQAALAATPEVTPEPVPAAG